MKMAKCSFCTILVASFCAFESCIVAGLHHGEKQTSVKLNVPMLVKSPCSVFYTNSRLPPPDAEDSALYMATYKRLTVAGPYWCARRCLQQHRCKSINFDTLTSTCELNRASHTDAAMYLLPSDGYLYYKRESIPEVMVIITVRIGFFNTS